MTMFPQPNNTSAMEKTQLTAIINQRKTEKLSNDFIYDDLGVTPSFTLKPALSPLPFPYQNLPSILVTTAGARLALDILA